MKTPTIDYGFPVRVHYAADVGDYRSLEDIFWFVVHDTEGYPRSDEAVLTSASAPVSSTHVLILPDGETVFMVDLNQTAWTCGNDYYSRHSINVELSGFASKGYTEAQYRSLAAYFVWCKKQGVIIPLEYTGKSGKNGIIYHSDIPDPYKPGYFGGFSNHTDPGALFDCDKFIKYVNEIEAAELFDFRHVPETDKALAYGFKSLWEKLEKQGDNLNLRMLGYPVTDEFNFVFSTGEAYTIQMFERGGLIYDPTASNEWKIRQMTLRQVSEVYSKL